MRDDVTAEAIDAVHNRGTLARWSLSAILIVALHAGLIAAAILWVRTDAPPGVSMPTILVDMSLVSASPAPQQMDAAPGPQMEQADAPSPSPFEETALAPPGQIAPKPFQERPEVQATPDQIPQPAPPKPEPATTTPAPPKPQVRLKPDKQPNKQSDRPPAPQTSAAISAERRAPQAAAMAGAAAAALPSYRQMLAAHLQRFKQYPAAAKSSGATGTSMLSFTVTRSGGISGARLSGSSGNAVLDAETMAMIRRAQPLPAFPPAMTQSSLSFTMPVRFAIGN